MRFNQNDFNKWFNDGNAMRTKEGYYIEQSTQWKKRFTYKELKAFYIKEYLND